MKKITLVVLALLVTAASWARMYEVTVTWEAKDLYKYDDGYIKTNYCYEYAYYDRAIVDTSKMVLYFLDSGEKCDIEEFLE